MNGFKTFAIAAAFIASAFGCVLWTSNWTDIPISLGGTELAADAANNRCWWFENDNQTICYKEKETWYGTDAEPVYVIEEGRCTTINGQCPN